MGRIICIFFVSNFLLGGRGKGRLTVQPIGMRGK